MSLFKLLLIVFSIPVVFSGDPYFSSIQSCKFSDIIFCDSLPIPKNGHLTDSIKNRSQDWSDQIDIADENSITCQDSIEILNKIIDLHKQKNQIITSNKNAIQDSFQLLKDIVNRNFLPKGARAFTMTLNENTFSCFEVNPKYLSVKMHLLDSTSNIIGNINTLKRILEKEEKLVLFCTNGGMFQTDYSPQGLYVENNQVLYEADKRKGLYGNFYIEPNGIFYINKEQGPGIIATEELTDSIKSAMLFATQSGPLVVYNHLINQHFNKNSKSLNIRSGVGILENGNIIFAISEEKVNFFDFATVFKDLLHCSKALYLDGAISESYIPSLYKLKTNGLFGPLISVSK